MAEETKDGVSVADVQLTEAELSKDAHFMDKMARQIGTFGLESMAKWVNCRILIVGMKGLGVETAKNVILSGPRSVTILDNEVCRTEHMGANFFVSADDVAAGKTLGAAVQAKLQELNGDLTVKLADKLNTALLAEHDGVIFTEGKRSDLVEYNAFCHAHKPAIAFISTAIFGVCGQVFSDMGPAHRIFDRTGVKAKPSIVTKIETTKEGHVHLLSEAEGGTTVGHMHDIPDDDHEGWVKFTEVKGCFAMDEPTHAKFGLNINKSQPFRAHFVTPQTVAIGDLTHLSPYIEGGLMEQVKKPIIKSYRTMSESLLSISGPGIGTDPCDYRCPTPSQQHFAHQAVYQFYEDNGHLPRPNNDEDAEKCVAIAKALNDASALLNSACGARTVTQAATWDPNFLMLRDEFNDKIVRSAAHHARAELQPMATLFGAIAAQEMFKITGKYDPIDQWLYLNFMKVLPDERPKDVEVTKPEFARYAHQISVFGEAFQEKLRASSTFLVGCGALGCEHLKNLALLGISCGKGDGVGTVTATDDDVVEVSNLSRQFLFRANNVGHLKSEAAVASVKAMNPDFNVDAHKLRVMPQSEEVYNDEFWVNLGFVTNALDNVHARNYVDSKCVLYNKPLLESATMGTQANFASYVPNLTNSYQDGAATVTGGGTPMCTARNFPTNIDHCCEWARSMFHDHLTQPFKDVRAFLEADRKKWNAAAKEALRLRDSNTKALVGKMKDITMVLDAADAMRGKPLDDQFHVCIEIAVRLFYSEFRDRIKSIVLDHPFDEVSNDVRFWGPQKRFPHPPETLDVNDPLHIGFITATANILAVCFGLAPDPEAKDADGNLTGAIPETHEWRNPAFIGAHVKRVDVPAFVKYSDISTNEQDAAEEGEVDETQINEGKDLRVALNKRKKDGIEGLNLTEAKFEKDHDWNFHLDFIYTFANMRATIYSIKNADRHTCKMIAGSIIPAIATTTAMATAFAMLEMYQVMQRTPGSWRDKNEDAYTNGSANLADNSYNINYAGMPSISRKRVVKNDDGSETVFVPYQGKDKISKWEHIVISGSKTVGEFIASLEEVVGAKLALLFYEFPDQCSTDFLYPFEEPEWKEYMDKPMEDYVRDLYANTWLWHKNRKLVQLRAKFKPLEDGSRLIVPNVIYNFSNLPGFTPTTAAAGAGAGAGAAQ